ncbi:hypothetical protein [Streptomyces sp. NPDC056796]|uniref:hypothetical protein n=1 Tax=unclassified Streptomyces TaxID=2593676 RepID=UPI003688790D
MVSDALAFQARVRDDVAAIEALRSGPLTPPWPGCADPARSASGDGFAVVALRVGRDLHHAGGPAGAEARTDTGPGDDSRSTEAAYDAFETERWGVVLALDERWGPHGTLATYGHAERHAAGEEVPPLLGALFDLGYFDDELQVWETGGRRVAVGTGQADREEPVVLYAAVALSPQRW